MPENNKVFNIAIIGGGFTGTMAAVHLIKNAKMPVSIALINKGGQLAKGTAYSTTDRVHLLNVPARNMSAYPDEPGHFVNWLRQNNRHLEMEDSGLPLEEDFVPRLIYGEYISAQLYEAISEHKQAHIQIFEAEAVDINMADEKAHISLDSGDTIRTEKVLFAMGNNVPANLHIRDESFYETANYQQNPYDLGKLAAIAKTQTVLIIGTGLTMVDVVNTLKNQGHEGTITGISRNGKLPHPHSDFVKYPDFIAPHIHKPPRELLAIIEEEKKKAGARGIPWQSVIDSMRPHHHEIWTQFSPESKKYFAENLGAAWGVVRHRMARAIMRRMEHWQKTGELEIKKGSLASLSNTAGKVEVVIKDGDAPEQVFWVDYVINCTGPMHNIAKIDKPFYKNMLAKGIISPGPLNIGLNSTPEFEVIDKEGGISEMFYVAGPLLIGVLWESIAVPELRRQARDVADKLLKTPPR